MRNNIERRGYRKGAMIEGVIAVAVIVASTVIVVNMISSTVDEGKAYQNYNKAKETMSFLDTVIRELALEAPGARRTINLESDFGTFSIDGQSETLKFYMENPVSILDPGSSVREGNLLVTSGSPMRAYESDVDSDGTMDLVLENEAVLFAIEKVGSPTNETAINTRNIITQIKNKRTDTTITPTAKISLDENNNNSYGDGFTELTVQGSNIASGSIRVYVNSTGTKQYDAIFTLRSGQDFVELEIKNIKDK